MFRSDSPNLDCLRAFAVMLVLAYHLVETAFHLRGFASAAHFGVLIFFVHTSLVLMLSMERAGERGWRMFGSFYIRRVLRIYPLSIAIVLCAVVSGYRMLSGPDLVSNLALTMNLTLSRFAIDPLWSLPYEVQMYVALPFLYLFARRFRSAWATSGLLLPAVALALLQPHWSERADLAQYVGCFLPGIMAYQISKAPRFRWPAWLWPVFLGAATVFFVGVTQLHLRPVFPPRWFTCLLIGICAPQFRPIPDGFIRRAAGTIAKYSYGIYLTHIFAIYLGFEAMAGQAAWLRWAVFAVLMVVMPVVAFHLIEQPGVKVGKRLAGKLAAGRIRNGGGMIGAAIAGTGPA